MLPDQHMNSPAPDAILKNYASKGRETHRASQVGAVRVECISASDEGSELSNDAWDPRNMTEEQAVRWSSAA